MASAGPSTSQMSTQQPQPLFSETVVNRGRQRVNQASTSPRSSACSTFTQMVARMMQTACRPNDRRSAASDELDAHSTPT